jgi:hypothetical protein
MIDRIIRHLKDYGSITTWEAITEYGCTRLSEYIRQARELGYNIDGEWLPFVNRYGEKSHYKRYILKKGN